MPIEAGSRETCYCAATEPGSTKFLKRSRSTVFWIFPVAVCGISSRKTTSSGIHQLATLPCRKRKISQIALPQTTCETVYAMSGYEQSVGNLSQVSLQRDNVLGDDGGIHQLATLPCRKRKISSRVAV